MSTGHLTLSEIAEARQWPAGDPRRLHLEGCARCRVLVTRHEQFVTSPAHVSDAELRDAGERLAEFLERSIGAPGAIAPAPAPELARVEPQRRAAFPWRRAAAWASVAAGVLIVGGLLLSRLDDSRGGASGVLRGSAPGATGMQVHREPAVALASGVVELRWRAVPAADRYEVRLFTPELREVATLAGTRDTTRHVSRSQAPGSASGDTLLWRVDAFRGEVRVAQSDLGTLRLP